MDEAELKATVGEAAFNAMSPEQRAAMMGKVVKSKEPPKDDDKKKKKQGQESDDEDEEESEDDEQDPSNLRKKVAQDRKNAENSQATNQQIEAALKFNLSVEQFVKDHADLLPGEVPDILSAANKVKYDSAAEKAQAIKVAMIDAFFEVKENLDSLTASQKQALDEFGKLTKNGKERKADSIYENIFEPALVTMKKVKKAEELGKARSGHKSHSKSEDNYKNRLVASSEQTYLGKKGDSK